MDQSHSDYNLYIARLIKKNLFDDLSAHEEAELNQWINASPENQTLYDQLTNKQSLVEELLAMEEFNLDAVTRNILTLSSKENQAEAPVKTLLHWKYAAAAVLLIALSGASWLFLHRTEKTASTPVAAAPIIPGGNKAVLTLADGSKLALDSAHNGLITDQGPSTVFKLNDGQLAYRASEKTATAPMYNTLSTPRGGQYQLTLPDGSRVWLNSASSITFPTFFNEKERIVKISGEAYFEVESLKDRYSPFIVEAGTERITVLGTHFNINAYGDDQLIRTSLLEGAVKVSNFNGSITIKPGEQALGSTNRSAYQVIHPNMEEVLAWKNGRFLFNNASAASIVLQLSRWYDIDIVYKGDLSGINFSGGVSRKDRIEKLIELLEVDGRMKLELKGRTLIVMRKP